MKTAVGLMVAVCVCHVAVVAFPLADPGRLLRVPRIYNALIRSDAKLQPSRASPYSSPVYQPVGLGPEPGFDQWQPPPYALGPLENSGADELRTSMTAPKQIDDNDKSKLKPDNTKTAAPLTFYPRSFGYYQPQPILPYGYPFGPHPYLFGSPYEFGQQPFFRYPTQSFDGYYGGLYSPGVEQHHNAYHPNNMEPEQTKKKPDEEEEKEIDIKSSSDSVGVRESEFLVDEEEAEDGSEVADLKKGSHEAEATS